VIEERKKKGQLENLQSGITYMEPPRLVLKANIPTTSDPLIRVTSV
jgi:hypothetical protein